MHTHLCPKPCDLLGFVMRKRFLLCGALSAGTGELHASISNGRGLNAYGAAGVDGGKVEGGAAMTSSNPVYKRRRLDVSPPQPQVCHTNTERSCMSSWS